MTECYFDASLDRLAQLAGLGAVIIKENEEEVFINNYVEQTNTAVAEAQALLNVLKILKKSNITNDVRVYGDHQGLIGIVSEGTKSGNKNMRPFIKAINEQLKEFKNTKVVWVRRNFNKAHDQARLALEPHIRIRKCTV